KARDVLANDVTTPPLELVLLPLAVLDHQRALVHAVAPVVVHAVAGADRDVGVPQGCDRDVEATTRRVRKRQPRRLSDHARSRFERVLELGPPEPLVAADGIVP